MKVRLGTLLISMLLLESWPAEARGADSPRALAARLMTIGEVPGMTMAEVRRGSVTRLYALGIAEGQNKRPISDETIFEAASLSKPVVAYAVLKLVDQGKLALDNPIADYADGGPLAGDPRWRKISIRMLLSHTSGLPNELHPGEKIAIGFEPGSRFSYSGIGYSFLQQAIEKVTGESFETAIERLVFDPLAMKDSSFIWRSDYEGRKAAGHSSAGRVNAIRKPAEPKAPSSLHTTARDYGRFFAAILGRRGLSLPTWAAMTTPQVSVQEDCLVCIGKPAGAASPTISWGLGWGIQTVASKHYLFHWGENNGDFQAFVIGEPATRSGFVALTNSGNGLSIIPAITAVALPSAHPAFKWMGYDSYDSPARVIQRRIIASGASSVLAQATHDADLNLTESQWNRIGYQLLARGRVEDAVAVFELNTRLFPKSANTYDSLGEALLTEGRNREALANYRRSLELDPSNDNARRLIAKLTGEQPK